MNEHQNPHFLLHHQQHYVLRSFLAHQPFKTSEISKHQLVLAIQPLCYFLRDAKQLASVSSFLNPGLHSLLQPPWPIYHFSLRAELYLKNACLCRAVLRAQLDLLPIVISAYRQLSCSSYLPSHHLDVNRVSVRSVSTKLLNTQTHE